jgi:hypothetical protein
MAPAPGGGHLCGFQLSNFQDDNFKIVRDVGIPEAQYRDAAFIQPTVTPSVSRFMVGVCMLATVEFNGEPQRGTIEVKYK